jgi:hypothetical protein
VNASPVNVFRFCFFLSLSLAAVYLALFILSIGGMPGEANSLDTSLSGTGTADLRHDNERSSDRAMAEDAAIMYDYSRKWGVKDKAETATSSFIVSGGTGGYKTQYAVKGSGAGHKVDYRATKISGDSSFASEITLSGNEAGGENFDSVIEFDTLSGNATIRGRIYNQTAGRPATTEEIDAVGKYILQTHLNVSTSLTPDNWLGFCGELDRDMILDPSMIGIWIAPLNDSQYNYVWDGAKVSRQLNTTGQA